MAWREISESEWVSFFDQFSRLHQGQDADVEIADHNSNARAPARNLPLLGITAERLPGQTRVEIVAGMPDGPHVRHSVLAPRRVLVAEWNDGVSAALDIESDDGLRTKVRVGPPEQMLPPGMITDGLYQRGP